MLKMCSVVVSAVVGVVSFKVLVGVDCGEVGAAVVSSGFGDTQFSSVF